MTDMDINLEDFQQKVNADLVGKVVNIASRCAGFINKQFDGNLCASVQTDVFDAMTAKAGEIAALYEQCDYSKAMREIMTLADQANQFIAEEAPWALIKQDETRARAHQVCSDGLNLFRLLMVYLKPVIPGLAERAEQFLNIEPSRGKISNRRCVTTRSILSPPCWRASTKSRSTFWLHPQRTLRHQSPPKHKPMRAMERNLLALRPLPRWTCA